jgi:NADPH:quinone reductase-like Zn-dependent oxidoreductase
MTEGATEMTAEPRRSGETMKAIVYHRYGGPEVLRVEDIPIPEVNDGQILVRVVAASVNPLDWHLLRGEPYIARFDMGWRMPKQATPIPGVDVAGMVEAVGAGVTRFKPGDEVWGHKGRALAEYVCARETLFLRKPARLTLVETAAIPAAALTALQSLRDAGHVKAGQKVLINGASGGVGTFSVQLAKHFGAHVTGVTSTPNVELVRSIGADEVIDYTRDDFTRSGPYDLIIDNVGNRSPFALRRALGPGGSAVLVGALAGRWVAPFPRVALAAVISLFGDRKLRFMLAHSNDDDMATIHELVEAGKVTPVIDRCYPLAETAEAIRYLETLRARGKVVITI